MTIRVAFALLASFLFLPRSPTLAGEWWNPAFSHRLPLRVAAAGVERSTRPVEVEVDLTIPEGADRSAIDQGSLRLVEVDAGGRVIDDAVPFQFERSIVAGSGASGRGTFVFVLQGVARAEATRQNHAYFRTGGRPLTAPAIPAQVVVTDGVMLHETMECFKVETLNATYFYGKRGAGFAGIVDRDGNDWISYRPGGRGAGDFRGLPKFGQREKLFHCGYGFGAYAGPAGFTSKISRQGPLRVRIDSATRDGLSACAWDFFPSFATVTLRRIKQPSYWFLYEGTPGGRLDPDRDYVVRPGGRRTPASEPWSDNVPWAYMVAAETDRALFVANHQRHDLVDSYVAWPFVPEPDGSFQQMAILGFGRKGYKELVKHIPDLTTLPARFTIGFTDRVDPPGASMLIESCYRDVAVAQGAVESR